MNNWGFLIAFLGGIIWLKMVYEAIEQQQDKFGKVLVFLVGLGAFFVVAALYQGVIGEIYSYYENIW